MPGDISDLSLPPGPPGLPVVGNTHQFIKSDPFDWFTQLKSKYGDVVYLTVAGRSVVLLSDPEIINRVLVTNNQNYRKGGFQKLVTRSLLGDGLVLAEGETWRKHRRGIEPTFHPDRIQEYGETVEFHTREFLDRWSDGSVFDLQREMKRLTLGIIMDTLFGIDHSEVSQDLETAFNRVLQHFERISQTYVYIPEGIPTPENRAYRRALTTIDETVYDIIEAHRDIEGTQRSVVADLVDGDWGKRELRDEIVTLLTAGHETSALTLTFTGYLLGRHPDIAQRVAREVRDLDGNLTHGLADCALVDKVLKESLRLYPPVYGIFREPVDDVAFDDYRIPAGSLLALNQWVVHRDERWFDAPRTFRPDRWTAEFESNLPVGAYFPFAAGPRRCLGDRFAEMMVKLILALVLCGHQFSLVSDRELEVVPSLTTRPKNPVRVRLAD